MKHHFSSNRIKSAGFTLLEILLAMVIFAMLSLTAYQVLHASLRNDEIMSSKSAEISALQYTMELLEQDLSQIVQRPGNAQAFSDFLAVPAGQEAEANDDLLMVRANWFNPGNLLPRSQLLRCGYRIRQGALQRVTYPQVDILDNPSPPSRTLLHNVRLFQLSFLSQGRWQRGWQSPATLPEAVEITLDAGQIGKIQRIILLTSGSSNERQP